MATRALQSVVIMAGVHAAVFVILAVTAGVVHLAGLIRRILGLRWRPYPSRQFHVLVTGTFYNENWFRSHILPLSAAPMIEEIVVVTDKPLFDVDKVKYSCPPAWALRWLGRTVPRATTVLWQAFRRRPDVLMGYHIMPNGLICLVASALFGGRSAYQMTGGPIQIIGGGVGSENALLCRLGRHSRVLEAMLFHVVSLFDLVVVRGRKAEEFVLRNGLARRTLIVAGSIDADRFRRRDVRKEYDLVLVARHIKEKQPHLFLEIVAQLRKQRPDVRAALAGDGPLTAGLKQLAERLGIERNVAFLGKIEHIEEVLCRSSIFLLTSQTEGLSIAMVEAMACGVPVLAPNVGELGELLIDGENGLLIKPEDTDDTARLIDGLLGDPSRLERMAEAASRLAMVRNGVRATAERWRDCLTRMCVETTSVPVIT